MASGYVVNSIDSERLHSHRKLWSHTSPGWSPSCGPCHLVARVTFGGEGDQLKTFLSFKSGPLRLKALQWSTVPSGSSTQQLSDLILYNYLLLLWTQGLYAILQTQPYRAFAPADLCAEDALLWWTSSDRLSFSLGSLLTWHFLNVPSWDHPV